MANGFGSIAPGRDDEEDLLNRYYDPGTGLPAPGPDKYAPRQSYISPELMGTQMGELPPNAAEAQNPYPPGTEQWDFFEQSRRDPSLNPMKQIRRPGVLPMVNTPEAGYQLVKPRIADLYRYITGGPVIGSAAEAAAPSGAVLSAGLGRMNRARSIAADAAKAATEEMPPPPMGHNMPPPEAEMPAPPAKASSLPTPPDEYLPIRADRSKFVDDQGRAIEGAAYTKEARRILDEIKAGPKGDGPIDLSDFGTHEPRPQTMLERYDPPQGVSDRLSDAFNNPDVLNGVEAGIRKGVEMGAHKWYVNDAVKNAFIKELGPQKGTAEFERMMDNVAATSPRSDVPTNVRNASYYFTHATPADLPEKNPYPYGHVAQNLHRQNFETITSPEGWDIMKNPKPASFSENLKGNYEPVTADTHAFRAIGMRTQDPRFLEPTVSAKYKMGTDPTKDTIVNKYGEKKGDVVTFRPQQLFADGKLTMDDALKIPYFWAAKPKANEYGAVEDLYRHFGDKHGLTPAGAQAAGWAGSGELTGLGTVPTHTFPELLNERIKFTAMMRGEDPKQTLSDFIRGRKPLLSTAIGAGLGAAAAAGAGGRQDEEKQ